MPEPDLRQAEADRDLLAELASQAGEVALRFFGADQTVWTKGDESPVGEADLAVNAFLTKRLAAARPDYAILSEEDPTPSRAGAGSTVIVDPIDGTRAFIKGGEHWTICLAVVVAGRPTAAVVLAPCRKELFAAAVGAGTRLNGIPVRGSKRATLDGACFAGPRRLLAPLFEAAGLPAPRHPYIASLAYHLARVADARLDGVVARRGAYAWDVAAADLLIAEAGGRLTDFAGRPLSYDGAAPRLPALIAAAGPLHAALLPLMAAVPQDTEAAQTQT